MDTILEFKYQTMHAVITERKVAALNAERRSAAFGLMLNAGLLKCVDCKERCTVHTRCVDYPMRL
jgi:hypothetical protein